MTAISHFLRAGTSLLWRAAILIALVTGSLVLISRAGRLAGSRPGGESVAMPPRNVAAAPPIDWSKVDAAVVEAAGKARLHAEQYADGELEAWTTQMLGRMDRYFLPWYFGYWNQQEMGLKACWQGVKYQVAGYVTDGDTLSPAQQMVEDIRAEFANRVLRPENAQLRLEQITRQSVDLYLEDLRGDLQEIQVRYSIPSQPWSRYLEGVATSVQRVDGSRQVPLSLKAVTASSAGGAAILAGSLARLAARVEVRLTAEAAERPIARLAAGAGSKLVARAGGKMLGPVIAVGVIAWDIWDHHQTVSENWPILRDALAEYLSLQKESLLRDPQTGVLATIHEVETGIARSLGHQQLTDRPPRP